ncbi:hypothetical protein ACEPPN_015356 [Leptodophora sp. 'Broadleaf-Isolate-01']
MGVSEIYEWLAEKYPQYQYNKNQIRLVLHRDSERKNPRFMIANKHRIAGVPIRWTIQPGTEHQLRRWLSGPPLGREPQVHQSLGETLQLIGYDKCNVTSDRLSSVPQSESLLTASGSSSIDEPSSKHRCHREPSMLTQQGISASGNPPSVISDGFQQRDEEIEKARELERVETSKRRDTKERSAKTATSAISTGNHQHSRGGRSTLINGTEAADMNGTNLGVARENAIRRQGPRGGFMRDPDSYRNRILYTKAAIALRKGMVELGRVKIDGDCMHNLLPRSIADELSLPLRFGDAIRIRVANRSIPISQYCRFSIQVAGVETMINTCVVSELPSLLLGRAWIQEVRLLRDFENHTLYISGPLGGLNKLPDPASPTEADTDFGTGERQGAPAVEQLPTAVEPGGCELGELANTCESIGSAAGDETISEDEVWEDAVSRQSTEDDLYSVDRILAEKQEDGRMYYLVLWDGYAEDESTWEPLQNIRDTLLLDIWQERKAQELRGMAPAFDLVRFEERRRERLGLALRKRRSKPHVKRVSMQVFVF